MKAIARPNEEENISIQPSTIIGITAGFGIVTLLVVSLSRQESTKKELEDRIDALENEMQNMSDTIAMMRLERSRPERKVSRPKQDNVFAGGGRPRKKYDL